MATYAQPAFNETSIVRLSKVIQIHQGIDLRAQLWELFHPASLTHFSSFDICHEILGQRAPKKVKTKLKAVQPAIRPDHVTGWKSVFAAGHHNERINEVSEGGGARAF